jgi:hypothetical protein
MIAHKMLILSLFSLFPAFQHLTWVKKKIVIKCDELGQGEPRRVLGDRRGRGDR